ncbi:response regulator transcription factor [Paenibacillus dauci]|uniref:response regulator transcription factor n=2 Tax=Paenibacillus TaxID=44249 RepID=UPI0006191581|nr:response regulator transcription factor [Paenibacillus dauci]
MNELKLLVADDQTLMREGLKTILELEEDIIVVNTAANGQEAWEMVHRNEPDIVLLDIQMPVMDGICCARQIKQHHPDIIVLLLSTFMDEQYIMEGMRSGANGYLLKDMDSRLLIQTIRSVTAGQFTMPAAVAIQLAETINRRSLEADRAVFGQFADFTRREQEIITLMRKGLSNKQIAQQLYIHSGTVRNYISIIYAKMGVNDRTSALMYLQAK